MAHRAPRTGAVSSTSTGAPAGTLEVDTGLARRYLDETGLSADAVWGVLSLERDPMFPHARERLTQEERLERQALGKIVMRLGLWAMAVPGVELEQNALPDEEAEAVHALREDAIRDPRRLAATVEEREAFVASVRARLAAASPTVRHFTERQAALDARCRLTGDEVRARITAHLTHPDGTMAPAPAAWCARQEIALETFETAFFFLLRTEMDEERARIEAARAQLLQEREELNSEKRRPLPVRTGKAFLATVNATPESVHNKRRKAKGLAGVDKEAERLFLASDHRPLGAYERAAIVGLANLAWDRGVLEGLDEAKMERRIIDPRVATVEDGPPRVRIPFPGYAEIAKRAGAQPDGEGRIPQHYTRAMKRALEKLTQEPRLIPEPVRLLTKDGLVDTFAVRSALWIVKEAVGDSGPFLLLDVAACTAMLSSWVDRPLLADYERAREASGAKELRDDLVALEDYLAWRRNTALGAKRGAKLKPSTGGKGRRARGTTAVPAEVPAPAAATEADRVVVAEVLKTDLWKRMGWTKEAKKRGPKAGQQREDEGLAFCRARGLLVHHEERDGEKGRVLVLTLAASTHPDPAQGTLFLPGGRE